MSKSGLIGSRLMCRWVLRAVSYALQGIALASSPCLSAEQCMQLCGVPVLCTLSPASRGLKVPAQTCWVAVRMVIRVGSRQLSMAIPGRFQGRAQGPFKVTCSSRQLNESKSKAKGIAWVKGSGNARKPHVHEAVTLTLPNLRQSCHHRQTWHDAELSAATMPERITNIESQRYI